MGNVHSLYLEAVLAGALITAAVIYYRYPQEEHPNQPKPKLEPTNKGKKKKKKKVTEPNTYISSSTTKADANPIVVRFPEIIPGQFDPGFEESSTSVSQPKQSKKKRKSKGATTSSIASESPISTPTPSTPSHPPHTKHSTPSAPSTSHSTLRSHPSIDTGTDGSWTRVESHSRRSKQTPWSQEQLALSSDAAGTTGTADSSPVAEKADEDMDIRAPWSSNRDRMTLAEQLLPKPKKTEVDDMLEAPNYPPISRVMRVRPRPDEKPVSGFTWADYEDVHVGEGTADVRSGGAGNDADGEEEKDDDNDGWGVVKSRRRPKPNNDSPMPTSTRSQYTASKPAESLTKRQRQNVAKREAQKAEKASTEAERLATFAKHKRELEHAKIMEQFANESRGKKKNISGGMTASVDDNGKLVWE